MTPIEDIPEGEGGLHDSHGHLHNNREHYEDNDLLEEITKNLPANVCAAHGMMILFIKNNNKNSTKRFDELDKKIDPVIDFVLQKKIEEEAQDQLEKKEAKEDKTKTSKLDRIDKYIIAALGIIVTVCLFVAGLLIR
jgi:DNA-binding HxlR family transcriptional regulator